MGRFTNLYSHVHLNWTDVKSFGPRFALRHIAKLQGRSSTVVKVGSAGFFHVRVGESDVAAIRQVFRDGDYDLGKNSFHTKSLTRKYKEILANGRRPVIVDAGANIGVATRWFSQHWPEAGIVAIEPEPRNAEILRRNIQLLPSTVVKEAAIGCEPGFVRIDGDETGWGARTTRSDGGIPVITIQEAVASFTDGVPFIAKIDVEGFESELFEKNTDWIGDFAQIIIEPHDWMLPGQGSSLTFQKAMAKHSFEMLISGENLIYVQSEKFDVVAKKDLARA